MHNKSYQSLLLEAPVLQFMVHMNTGHRLMHCQARASAENDCI